MSVAGWLAVVFAFAAYFSVLACIVYGITTTARKERLP